MENKHRTEGKHEPLVFPFTVRYTISSKLIQLNFSVRLSSPFRLKTSSPHYLFIEYGNALVALQLQTAINKDCHCPLGGSPARLPHFRYKKSRDPKNATLYIFLCIGLKITIKKGQI